MVSFEIGNFEDWCTPGFSDHAPLIAEFSQFKNSTHQVTDPERISRTPLLKCDIRARSLRSSGSCDFNDEEAGRLPAFTPAARAAEWGGEKAGTVIALKMEGPSIKVLSFCMGKLASGGE